MTYRVICALTTFYANPAGQSIVSVYRQVTCLQVHDLLVHLGIDNLLCQPCGAAVKCKSVYRQVACLQIHDVLVHLGIANLQCLPHGAASNCNCVQAERLPAGP